MEMGKVKTDLNFFHRKETNMLNMSKTDEKYTLIA